MNTSGSVTFFIMEGLQERKMLMFGIFLTIYVVVLSGNGMIIYLVRTDPKLQSPMYFFLHNLSFADMVFTTVTMPHLLSGLLKDTHIISKTGCMMQMYFFLSTGSTGRVILTVMAFDRYVAICNPLRYTTIMTKQVCILLVFASWCFGYGMVTPALCLALQRQFCGPNRVKHAFCDHSSVVRLACDDTTVNNYLSLSLAMVVLLGTFFLILASYIRIGITVYHMGRAERTKAFTTCASHLTVVCFSYVSATCVYISYRVATFSPDARTIVAVVYSVLTPFLNPFIYSLRNKELWQALTRAHIRCVALPSSQRKTIPTLS